MRLDIWPTSLRMTYAQQAEHCDKSKAVRSRTLGFAARYFKYLVVFFFLSFFSLLQFISPVSFIFSIASYNG